MKKYLITTADEATWKFDEKVVFLGEWCRLYNRKHIWKEMDYCAHGFLRKYFYSETETGPEIQFYQSKI